MCICTSVHPLIHAHGLSARWCPMSLTSSLGEFLGYSAGSGILGYHPCWCPSPFPSPPISVLWCFSFPLLPLPLDFIRVSSSRPTYLNPFDRPFPYSLFS